MDGQVGQAVLDCREGTGRAARQPDDVAADNELGIVRGTGGAVARNHDEHHVEVGWTQGHLRVERRRSDEQTDDLLTRCRQNVLTNTQPGIGTDDLPALTA